MTYGSAALQGERLRVVDRRAGGRDLQGEQHTEEKAGATSSWKNGGRIAGAYGFRSRLPASRREVISLIFFTEAGEIGSSVSINGFTSYECTFDLANDRDIEFRHVGELALEIVEQIRLMQQLGAVRREMPVHDRGQNLRCRATSRRD